MDEIKIPAELSELYNRNDEIVKKKIMKELLTKPKKSDGDGFIYGYYSPYDKNLRNNFYMKLGRTERSNPEDRIIQQDGNIIFLQKSCVDRKLETLIQLFFSKNMLTRVINGKKQIEWFHFTERINIVKYVSLINDLIEETFDLSTYIQDPIREIKDGSILNLERNNVNQEKININKCTKEDLKKLPRIKDKLADKIVLYRTTTKFNCIDDIKKVPRVGEVVYEKIKDFICV